jgi:cytochrome oxidase Cu insertion factor (SCO1/SenC/PrrC family)
MTGYQINETDIEGVIRFLEVTDPDNATPEVAIELLEHLKASFHTLAHEDPKKLEEIYEELKRQKQLKTN